MVGRSMPATEAGRNSAGGRGAVVRGHRDPDAQAVARVVWQARHVFFALVHVFDVVADHLALFALDFDDLAAPGFGLCALLGDVVADGAASDRTCDRGRLAAVAAADLIAQG